MLQRVVRKAGLLLAAAALAFGVVAPQPSGANVVNPGTSSTIWTVVGTVAGATTTQTITVPTNYSTLRLQEVSPGQAGGGGGSGASAGGGGSGSSGAYWDVAYSIAALVAQYGAPLTLVVTIPSGAVGGVGGNASNGSTSVSPNNLAITVTCNGTQIFIASRGQSNGSPGTTAAAGSGGTLSGSGAGSGVAGANGATGAGTGSTGGGGANFLGGGAGGGGGGPTGTGGIGGIGYFPLLGNTTTPATQNGASVPVGLAFSGSGGGGGTPGVNSGNGGNGGNYGGSGGGGAAAPSGQAGNGGNGGAGIAVLTAF